MEELDVVVEKGIPIPRQDRSNLKVRVPWDTMEIGDSFIWPKPAKNAVAVRNTLHQMGIIGARCILIKKGVVRVWKFKEYK